MGPRFHLHGAWHSWHTNCKVFLWGWCEMSGSWGRVGAHKFAPCDTASCDSSEFTTTNPQGNRGMAPPQASPDPLWPLSLVYHLLVWPVQCTVYTWSCHQTSDGQRCHCISCWSNWNNQHRKRNLCQRHWDTCHRRLCQTSEAHRAPVQISGP